MSNFKHNEVKTNIPTEFSENTKKTIERIENNHNVLGVLHLRNESLEFYSVSEITAQCLASRLPPLNDAMHRAVAEITNANWKKMKIITNLLKDSKDEWLVHTTALINSVNPIVDRIMDDESVEGVVMTNKEGAPILTNVSLTTATHYGQPLNRLATMTCAGIKELDIFDKVLTVRLITKKKEIMLAPDAEFNVIVVQHARPKVQDTVTTILHHSK